LIRGLLKVSEQLPADSLAISGLVLLGHTAFLPSTLAFRTYTEITLKNGNAHFNYRASNCVIPNFVPLMLHEEILAFLKMLTLLISLK
jgi:hypothetical protein